MINSTEFLTLIFNTECSHYIRDFSILNFLIHKSWPSFYLTLHNFKFLFRLMKTRIFEFLCLRKFWTSNEVSFLDAVYALSQRKRICGRKRVKIEISHRGKIKGKSKRDRSISPETYRKYGSRTPSPVRKRSRSRFCYCF